VTDGGSKQAVGAAHTRRRAQHALSA